MGGEQTNMNRSSAAASDVLRPLRVWVVIAWTVGGLSVALPLVERRLRVVHPFSIPFVILLIVLFGAALVVMVRGFWRLLRGPRRFAAMTWTIAGLLPPLFWLALGWYGQRQWANRNVPNNPAMTLVKMAGARLMAAQARFLYPHQLETDRIVMFYGDSLTEPQTDLAAMDRHVARMEETTGLTPRVKIWWIRGALLGQGSLSLDGLTVGTSKSPVDYADRHELAHAIMNHSDYPDADPPTLLGEGWAEAQSVDGETLATRAADSRYYFTVMGEWWDAIEKENKLDSVPDPQGMQRLFRKIRDEGTIDSYLNTLSDQFWYHHDAGVVYPIGGAFVDFLLRRYGPKRFIKLYFSVRPGAFKADCERIYGVDLDALEAQFWADVEQRKFKPPPRRQMRSP